MRRKRRKQNADFAFPRDEAPLQHCHCLTRRASSNVEARFFSLSEPTILPYISCGGNENSRGTAQTRRIKGRVEEDKFIRL